MNQLFFFLKTVMVKKTIDDIIKTMGKKFKNAPENILREDFTNILSRFSFLNLINWQFAENPFAINYTQQIKNLTYKIAEDADTLIVSNFFKKKIDLQGVICSVDFDKNSYSELAIRSKIFQKAEEYILVYNQEKELINIMVLEMPHRTGVTKAKIVFIYDISNFSDLCFFVKEAITDISILPIEKFSILLSTENSKNLEKVLMESNFVFEAKLLNETADNSESYLWALLLK